MAFPTGWNRKCPLVIDYTKVPGDLTNFRVPLTVENLPSEMFDADGTYPALSDGGDIRFTSDLAGTIQICVDIVRFVRDNNPANGLAEIWVKIPAVSSTINTTIYVWYNNSGASMPADNATYGPENVWNACRAEYHMNNASASTIKDFTSYHNTGTKSANQTTEVAGPFSGGIAQEFVQSTNTNIDCGNTNASDIPNTFTMSSWIYFDYTGYGSVWGKGQAGFGYQDYTIQTKVNGYRWTVNDNQRDDSGSSISTGVWYHTVMTYDGSNIRAYKNGVEMTACGSPFAYSSASVNDSAVSKINLGRCHADQNFDGKLDEVRLEAVTRTSQWIAAEYNSTNSPSTFVTEGTPVPAGGTIYSGKHTVMGGVASGVMIGIG